ncbi:hypothetical protein KC640_00400 [Candidatus Dojkabacteria bacterium]|uniref:Glycosyltransferase n=1 Tax=Candidatus Dojkabacteria bacterium TaxID=2099670 RepID=A0A955I4F7_9BACT|nr:hypothetical protein [Candidatus Dojkabacteria bacterium]
MKVVIALSDVSGGHMSAAKAIASSLQIVSPGVDVEIVDLMKQVGKFPFADMEKSWKMVSNSQIAESFSNLAYRLLGTKIGHDLSSQIINWRIGKDALSKLNEYKPDIVVSTHFVVSAFLESAKYHGAKFKTMSVAADLVGFPRLLADRNADLVFAPTKAAAERFTRFGLPKENVAYPFFPLDPKLMNARLGGSLLAELNLNPNVPTVLVTGGGLGTVTLLEGVDELLDIDIQIIILAGKSMEFQEKLRQRYKSRSQVCILGFVDNMQDYVSAVDLVISKPGPATIVELEALKKKALFTRPVGAQELGNVPYLMQNPNFRYIGDDYETICRQVQELLENGTADFAPRFATDAGLQLAARILEVGGRDRLR